MKSKEKGDLLESIVEMLERAFIDNPKTKILRNYNVTDRDGIERELDVYVETEVNSKVLKYAFECKNYGKSSSVKLQHITDFYSKIEANAIKGYFVSTGNIQKGAKDKAKKLGIELLSVEDTEESMIKNMWLLHKAHKIVKTMLVVNSLEDIPMHAFEVLYTASEEDVLKEDFSLELKKFVKNELHNNASYWYQVFFNLQENSFTWECYKKKAISIQGEIKNLFVKNQDKLYEIEGFVALVELWIENIEIDNLNKRHYIDVLSEQILSSFIHQEVALFGESKAFINIIQKYDNKDDLYYELELGNEIIKLETLHKFQPNEVTFTKEINAPEKPNKAEEDHDNEN